MASAPARAPVRITKVANRYLVFDIDDIMYLRRHHNLCSVFVGTMPQAPQQSVFMGLPVELMAEEARVLVDKGAARVVDDSRYHPARLAAGGSDPAYLDAVRAVGAEAGRQAREQVEARKAQFAHKALSGKRKEKAQKQRDMETSGAEQVDADTTLFATDAAPAVPSEESSRKKPTAAEEWTSTLTTSGALNEPLPTMMNVTPADAAVSEPVPVPRGYPLYAHLHHKGYYMMPGIRFGCDYNVYPGDPLKFHSHFQATGYGWDDEIDLLDIVTAGRLGTNVKKSFLIGAAVPPGERTSDEDGAGAPDVRAFSIEWAAM